MSKKEGDVIPKNHGPNEISVYSYLKTGKCFR